MNKVFIIIPSHNRKSLLRKCLTSIEKQRYTNRETVVIDDGSADGTKEMIKKEFPRTIILEGNGNLWWTGAMRLGVDDVLSKAKKGDYILTMNDDTIFEPEYLKKIITVSQEHNRAVVGSLCFESTARHKVVESGVKMDWKRGNALKLPVPKNYKKKKFSRDIDTFCGRGTLVPIEVFQKIGNFTRWLPHYGADYELFLRAKKAEFILLFSYEAVVYRISKPGGKKFEQKKISLKEWYEILFSKKSRSNIISKFHLIRLACPSNYKMRNYWSIFVTFLDVSAYTFPSVIRKVLVETKRNIFPASDKRK